MLQTPYLILKSNSPGPDSQARVSPLLFQGANPPPRGVGDLGLPPRGATTGCSFGIPVAARPATGGPLHRAVLRAAHRHPDLPGLQRVVPAPPAAWRFRSRPFLSPDSPAPPPGYTASQPIGSPLVAAFFPQTNACLALGLICCLPIPNPAVSQTELFFFYSQSHFGGAQSTAKGNQIGSRPVAKTTTSLPLQILFFPALQLGRNQFLSIFERGTTVPLRRFLQTKILPGQVFLAVL